MVLTGLKPASILPFLLLLGVHGGSALLCKPHPKFERGAYYQCGESSSDPWENATVRLADVPDEMRLKIFERTESLRFEAGGNHSSLRELFVEVLHGPTWGLHGPMKSFDFLNLPLSLEYIKLCDHQLEALLNVRLLAQMTRLTHLHLRYNSLRHFDFRLLPENFENIDISGNNLLRHDYTYLLYRAFRTSGARLRTFDVKQIPRPYGTNKAGWTTCRHLCAGFRRDLWFFDQWRLDDCAYIECYFCYVLQENSFEGYSRFSYRYSSRSDSRSEYFWTVFATTSCIPARVDALVRL